MFRRVSCGLSILFVSGLISFAAHAQPSISGVGMADFSTPMYTNAYWSIYGTNLSSGSGSHVDHYWFGINLFFPYDSYQYQNSDQAGGSAYWYLDYAQCLTRRYPAEA